MVDRLPTSQVLSSSGLPEMFINSSLPEHQAFIDAVVAGAAYTSDRLMYRGWPTLGVFATYEVGNFPARYQPTRLELAAFTAHDLPPAPDDSDKRSHDSLYVATLYHQPEPHASPQRGEYVIQVVQRVVTRGRGGPVPLANLRIPDATPIAFPEQLAYQRQRRNYMGAISMYGAKIYRAGNDDRPLGPLMPQSSTMLPLDLLHGLTMPSNAIMHDVLFRWLRKHAPKAANVDGHTTVRVSPGTIQ